MSFLFGNNQKEMDNDPVKNVGHYIYEILSDSPDVDKEWQFTNNSIEDEMGKSLSNMNSSEMAGTIQLLVIRQLKRTILEYAKQTVKQELGKFK